MATCKQCKEFEKCKDDAFINGAKLDPNESAKYCTGFEPITNADRIRAMSDEELYLWAKKQIGCGFDFFPCGVVCDGKCESFDDETCKAKIMEWLKQPTE